MDKAHKATDELLEAMERELAAIYREAQKGISDKAAAYFEQFQRLDEKKRKLVADGKLSEDEYLKWRKNKILYSNRFVTLQGQITAELARVNQTAAAYINDQLPDVYALNYNYVGKGVQKAVKGYSFTLIDANTVKRLATKTDSLLPKRKVDVPKDKLWNAKKMRAQVLQGILQGESMDKIADRMQTVTDMNGVSAIRNARTMVTGAENAGRIDMMYKAAADGVIMRKRWIATTDSRTRDWHRDLDGKEADIDEPFHNDFGDIMFPGDPTADGANVYNCRCTLGSKVVGFEKAQVQEVMAEKQVEERQASAFTPAKTTEEAEAYAKEHIFSGAYLGKTSYKGIDVDMANGINETLERITEKYGRKLSGIEVVNPKTAKGLKALGGSADAPFATNSLNGMVYINKDIIKNAKALKSYTDKGDEAFKLVMANKDKLSGKMRTLAEIYEKAGKDLVDSSLEGMITHEYGHYLAVAINPKSDVVSKIADGMGDHLVSGYSQHNVREYLAECFTEYELGDRSKLDPIVIELFEGAIKR